MKIRRVFANRRSKALLVQIGKKRHEIPFSLLNLKPTANDPIIAVTVEPGGERAGFTYRLRSGRSETVLAEQVVEMNRSPEHERKKHLYHLSRLAQEKFISAGIKKSVLARRLKCTPSHLYRLFDETFYGKTVDQMIKLLCALGTEVEWSEVA